MKSWTAGDGMNSRELYLRLLRYVRPYRRQFGLALLFTVLLALTEPAIPYLLKLLLDHGFVEQNPDLLVWFAPVLTLLFLVRGGSSFVSETAFAWISGRLVYDLRQQMFERILTLPTAFFDANPTGNIIAKLTHNVMQVTQAATQVIVSLVRDSVTIIGLLGYLLFVNWQLSLMVFVLLPLLVLVVRLIAKRLRRLSRRLQGIIGDMTHALEESVRGHKVVKIYGGEAVERDRFQDLSNWVRRLGFKAKVADAAALPLVEGIAAILIGLLILRATGFWGGERLSVGEFTSFLAAIGLLFPPIKRLTRLNAPLQRGLAGAESVFGLIDESPEVDSGDAAPVRLSGRVRFEAVGFRYPGQQRDALSGIDLELQPGHTLALVGPSGGGKTTIAALVPRLYDPTAGRILADGLDLQQIGRRALRRQVAYVGQEAVLFNDTIAGNIGYGMDPPPDIEQLREAARRAHALEFIDKLPEGFATLVGESGVRLSGGQRQRIAIARALIKDAPILLLDEATSALDTHSEAQVQAALEELKRDRATLVIAHRLSTIEHADRILVIKEGRVVESGNHSSLLQQGGEYAQLYSRQFKSQAGEAIAEGDG